MIEFLIFWIVVASLCAGLIYISYEHFRICNIRRRVDKDWVHMSDTINRMEEKLTELQDKYIESENRLESIRRDQITIKRDTDETSFNIHQTLENELKKNIVVKTNDTVINNGIKVSTKKKKKSQK